MPGCLPTDVLGAKSVVHLNTCFRDSGMMEHPVPDHLHILSTQFQQTVCWNTWCPFICIFGHSVPVNCVMGHHLPSCLHILALDASQLCAGVPGSRSPAYWALGASQLCDGALMLEHPHLWDMASQHYRRSRRFPLAPPKAGEMVEGKDESGQGDKGSKRGQ